MKTETIIKKNIKLLLRSRVSTLVLILGPLLIIVLVGISFSTSSFNLNMGVFSEEYSELSESFITKLNNESFSVTKYDTEELCVASVKEQQTHACIIFPPELEIQNEKSSIITFHVDQSKINLVYLVMSSLSSSFGEVSADISKELTNDIVSTLLITKTNLEESQSLLTEVKQQNTLILDNSVSSLNSLSDLNLDSSSAGAVSFTIDDIKAQLDDLKDDTLDLAEDGLDFVNDFDRNGLDSNQSDDLDRIEDTFDDIKDTIKDAHNSTSKELSGVVDEIDYALSQLTDKLTRAQSVNTDVINKLSSLKDKANKLKENSDALETNVNQMISKINSIQITNIENIVSPITTEIKPIAESKSNLGFLFPSLIVILIMFIGLLLPSTLIIMEKNSKAYFRIFTTPTKTWLYVLATYLTSLILVLLQVTIILSVSQFYFDINFLDSFGIISLSLLFIMSFFILFGMLIGYMFNTEEMAMLASVSIATLFLLTSGIIFPLETMPRYIIEKAKFNPVVLGSETFKKSLLFDASFSSIKQPLAYLFVSILLVLFLIFAVKRLSNVQLKKQKRSKIESSILRNYFDFGERKAKNLPEFIVSIQNFSEERFLELLKKDAYKDWLLKVYKNRALANKVQGVGIKEKLLDILTEEIKRKSKSKK